MNIFQKALSVMRHPPRPSFMAPFLKRTRFDYRKEVGDGIDSSVVTAPIQWVQRALPQARLTITRRKPDGQADEVPDHGALALIARPNDYYGDIALWAATVFSFLTDGNAYWLIVRNGAGQPAELWYVPHWLIEPRFPNDGSEYLSHYLYNPGGGIRPEVIDTKDVVHFRHGIDPRNPRKGLSPLAGTIREIFMDLESSNFVASLLRNMGVPGVVVAPKGGAMANPDDVKAVKSWFQQAFSGDRRGAPLILGSATDVHEYGFNPQQMNMGEARDVAEERVCACLGIPPAVVGFGAGLQQTKVGATMTEMVKSAWRNGVLPVSNAFADEIDRSLVPQFGDATGLKSKWDTTEVKELQDDLEKMSKAVNTMVQGGWMTVYAAKVAMGQPAEEADRIYLRSALTIEVPEGQHMLPPADNADEGKAGMLLETKASFDTKGRAGKAQRRAGLAYTRALERQEAGLAKAMEPPLKRVFKDLGAAARETALPLLEKATVEHKAEKPKSDDLLVGQILEALGIEAHQTAFRQVYETHYLAVAKEVSDAAELAGLAGSLPDPVARSIAGAGGKRAGLVDLGAQSRKALFDAIAEGRAEGEGAAALADRIAGHVTAGPWGSVETRARTIARTETKFAQNVSTIERAKAGGVERFIVFDGRLGPGRSDPDHMARDGSIVTAAEAAQMAADEHPNGTLSFAPYFDED